MKIITFEVTDEQYAAIDSPEEFAKTQYTGEADYRIREANIAVRKEHLAVIETLSDKELADIAAPIKIALDAKMEPKTFEPKL